MIAPEPGKRSNRQTSRLVVLRDNLLVSAFIFILLEIWRPHFFLTDDNLTLGFPVFTEIGNHLLSGRSPFVSDYLFGGNYNLLRDPSFLWWHPVYLFSSLLAGTPFHFWIMDVCALAMFQLVTAGFVNLVYYLRREMPLSLSDGWLMFFTMSFTYTIMAITTGSSWLTFLGNQSALPWLALGILQKKWREGIGLVMLFSLHHLLGGQLGATVSNSIFLTLFAAGVSIARKSVAPLVYWIAGYALAVVILSPFLLPLFYGFLDSQRSHGVSLIDMQDNNIPALLFPTSLFVGMALWIIHTPDHPYTTYTLALGSCAASWCLLMTLVSRARWRGLEVVCAALMVFSAILIIRPLWISQVMLHVPLLRSMRWPFRELLQFHFFMHLFLVLRPPGWSPWIQKRTAAFSTSIMVLPMLLFILPPTFNSMNWDRELLFSGRMARYWDQVRPLLRPANRVAVFIPWEIYNDDRFEEPYSLLATYNYSSLIQVINVWGYSPTTPGPLHGIRTAPFYPFGAYLPGQRASLLKEAPDLQFITLESLKPLKITLSSKDGPTIDLTPYIPQK